MATEFTKRAAAELSKCFNGLNVNKNSASSTKKASSANGTAATTTSNSVLITGNSNQTTDNESKTKANSTKNDSNQNCIDTIKSQNNTASNQCTPTTGTSSNLFTLTNSVKSIGSAYEQNILAAKTALRSPFKSPNKSSFSLVSNVVSSFNGLETGSNSDNLSSGTKLAPIPASPKTPRRQAPPKAPPKTNRARLRNYLLSLRLNKPSTVDELWRDEQFLKNLFKCFSPIEKCKLAQVNSQWKNLLYDEKECWKHLVPIIYFNELRKDSDIKDVDQKLYESLDRREFRELCIHAANDNDIMEFCMKSSNLQLLNKLESCSFKNCNITDKGLEFLLATANQNLTKLEILSCNDITDSGLWTGLVANLRSLTLMDCINVADETLATIALLPVLKEFTLQAYHVTDAGFSFFALPENGKTSTKVQIEVLNLISCWELSNQTLNHVATSMPKLKHLSLSGCSKISDDAVEIISEQLINLTHLDLSWCSHITSVSLEYLACDLADQLKSLILDRCIHITDQGLNYIASMTNLETLSLRWCPQIRDMGIQTICNMKSLKSLSIAGCSLVTSSGMTCLVRLPQLRELEVTNCPNVTDELLTYLKHHLPDCEIDH